jgi:class 3 adenylate cyclase
LFVTGVTASSAWRKQIVVTDELVTRVRAESAAADGLLDRFTRRGDVHVVGRDQPVIVWTLARGLSSV